MSILDEIFKITKMKNLLIALVLILSNNFVFSQNPNGANELVDIGINYHDKGD